MCWVAGWGDRLLNGIPGSYPDVLYQVQVPIIDLQKCFQAYFDQYGSADVAPGKKNLCAGSAGKDSCFVSTFKSSVLVVVTKTCFMFARVIQEGLYSVTEG